MSSNQSNNIYFDLFQTNLENNDSEPVSCEFKEVRNEDFLKIQKNIK